MIREKNYISERIEFFWDNLIIKILIHIMNLVFNYRQKYLFFHFILISLPHFLQILSVFKSLADIQ